VDGLAVRRDDRDALLVEMRMELGELLLGDLHLFERSVVICSMVREAPLLPFPG